MTTQEGGGGKKGQRYISALHKTMRQRVADGRLGKGGGVVMFGMGEGGSRGGKGGGMRVR